MYFISHYKCILAPSVSPYHGVDRGGSSLLTTGTLSGATGAGSTTATPGSVSSSSSSSTNCGIKGMADLLLPLPTRDAYWQRLKDPSILSEHYSLYFLSSRQPLPIRQIKCGRLLALHDYRHLDQGGQHAEGHVFRKNGSLDGYRG